MNKGLLCISVFAETAREMLEKTVRAAETADVVEVRFDSLRPDEIAPLLQSLRPEHVGKPLIATFRPREQGGRRELSLEQRIELWRSLPEGFWVDVEEEMVAEAASFDRHIVSFHDMAGVPADITAVYERLRDPRTDILKLAVTAVDAVDGIGVWKLLGRDDFIPIAMGEAGKWTRILGLAHGAYLTYASTDEGKETAPGQLTARDMVDVYRVRELDRETKVYGVIGDPVSESLSPYIHNAAFIETKTNAVFIPLLVKDLDQFVRRMVVPQTRDVELNFHGFAVTMPHKRGIIKHLDEIDPVAKEVGAVNTVTLENGKLMGYNTDVDGFIRPLRRHFGDLRSARVAVIGAGGAARACVYGLKTEGADIVVFARDGEQVRSLAGEFAVQTGQWPLSSFGGFDIVVNTTPMGMTGVLEDQTPLTAKQLAGVKFVFDIVTRTDVTPLLREAKAAGAPAVGGVEMLLEQALRQFEIWTGETVSLSVMRDAAHKKMNEAAR